MALYTTSLKELVDAGNNIFDFQYEFYDPTKKTEFETRFKNHFLYREICVEDVAQFKKYLENKCNETLPYYNMLFRTALIDYEKTVNYNLSDTYTREVNKSESVEGKDNIQGTTATEQTTAKTGERNGQVDGTTTTEGTTDRTETGEESQSTSASNLATKENRKVSSDTPSGLLSMSDIVTEAYATNAEIDKSTNSMSESLDTDGTKKATANSQTHDENVTSQTEVLSSKDDESSSGSSNMTSEVTRAQSGSGTEIETSTRVTKGSYGVITEADMLKKHIELQRTLTTIYSKFFDECNDLFMQIF